MELNNSIWMENGYVGEEPISYMGRDLTDFYSVGFRFHCPDLNQGDQVNFSRLRFISVGGVSQSEVRLVIRGVDEDSTPAWSQDNRPSQQNLTDSWVEWNLQAWEIYDFPVYHFSLDISPIINEILARQGWGTGPEDKTIAIVIYDNNSALNEANYLTFEDYYLDGVEGKPASLEIYETIFDTLIGGPVISKPTDDNITISINSRVKTDFYIQFGTSSGIYSHAIGNSQTTLPAIDPVKGLLPNQLKELNITGLSPDTVYYYQIVAKKNNSPSWEYGLEYTFTTRRSRGQPFNFVFMSDSHIGHAWNPCDESQWGVGFQTMAKVIEENPDLFILGGDEAQTVALGIATASQYDSDIRYQQVRRLYGPPASTAAIFQVLGNHDGEASYLTTEQQRTYSYNARMNHIPNPNNTTYPTFGGGPKENYFAWEWGDALFVCLDALSYTGENHPVHPSDWTLGEGQLTWLNDTLNNSSARWKFLFAHHIVGGTPTTQSGRAYGRGGAKYAHDWEQGVIHQMMLDHGAQIFFYGHDHVFAEGTADGVHYTLASQSTGVLCRWANSEDFLEAYPYGFFNEKGYIKVKVTPRSTWVDFISVYNCDEQEYRDGEIIYSYHLADVTVDLIPSINIPGDMLTSLENPLGNGPNLSGVRVIFKAVFTNSLDSVQYYDYWIKVLLPNHEEIIYDVKLDQELGPNESCTVLYNVFIPPHFESYVITAEVGDYPDDIISRDSFSSNTNPLPNGIF